MTTGTQ